MSLRDIQQDRPTGYCSNCGGELFGAAKEADGEALCERCAAERFCASCGEELWEGSVLRWGCRLCPDCAKQMEEWL